MERYDFGWSHLIQNSRLPCWEVKWICSIVTSGGSEGKISFVNLVLYLLTSYGCNLDDIIKTRMSLTLNNDLDNLLVPVGMTNIGPTVLRIC